MGICPLFVVHHNRPTPSSVSQLSQNLLDGFLSYFSCCLPWPICPEVFEFLKKKSVFQFSQIFLVSFVNMGPCGSKNLKAQTLHQIVFNFFSNFS